MKKNLISVAVLALTGSAAALAADPPLKAVGVSMGNMGNPFFVTLAKGAEEKTRELGGNKVKVTVDSADDDLGKQTNQIDNFIAAQVDLILLNPVHPEGIMPAVMRAKEANIPVIAVDAAAEGVHAMITSNNVQAGEKACQFIVDQLKGKGDVVIIDGPPVTAVADRIKGCKAVFAKNPGIKILSDNQNGRGSREGGLETMTNLLTAFPKIDAVFAINDPTGTGADLAARLGVQSAFMGKVGDDVFGHFLARTLAETGVDVRPLRFSAEARTALAFVSLQVDGEREFMFYRHPSTDMLFNPREVDVEAIQQVQLLHFGSISLIGEPSRSATLYAVDTARAAGCLISYDPNLRLRLKKAQVVKLSDDESEFLTGCSDLEAACQALWHDDLKLMVVTRGRAGCVYFTPEFSGAVESFVVEAVDATGAGDGFVAGLLQGVLADPAIIQDETRLRELCRFANRATLLLNQQIGFCTAP